jgi:hypothetical protein
MPHRLVPVSAAPTFAVIAEGHVVRFIATAVALFFTGAALADDWKVYENRDYSFTIHFPVDPTVETAAYQAPDGRLFPAHVLSAKQETGTFKVTLVEMPGEETGPDAAVTKEATKAVAKGAPSGALIQ